MDDGKQQNCNIKKERSYIFPVYIVIVIVMCLYHFITILAAERFENIKLEEHNDKANIISLLQTNRKKIQNIYGIHRKENLETTSFSVVGKGKVFKLKELECINVVVPTTYHVAFNPYGLEVQMGNGDVSTEQILSKKYGIINKSFKDIIVKVTFVVEDLNQGKIKFVDSDEDVKNAEMDAYAIYLAIFPSDGSEIMIGNTEANLITTAEELSNVNMKVNKNRSKVLYNGENQVKFRLSGAVYGISNINDIGDENLLTPELINLASDGTGITAFTFGGAMNESANWNELSKGVKITSIYTYEVIDNREDELEDIGDILNSNDLGVVLEKE